MFNPLIEEADLKNLKDSDIENKIFTLSRTYQFYARSGNVVMCEQVSGLIDVYKQEQSDRYSRNLKRVQVNNQNKDIDGLINVN